MMTKLNMYAACPNIPSVTIHSPKHNTIKSMVGLFPLAPHHDSLQYIHHVRLMQQGQNRGVTQLVVVVHLLWKHHYKVTFNSIPHPLKYLFMAIDEL